ncbi:MAG: tryptophan-rich sensory protein [Candidatus Sumerlaeaceae bacterium]|nr:tryptophan-rich sensory protein [Candidatus Sumerlaeaceae bacterium]
MSSHKFSGNAPVFCDGTKKNPLNLAVSRNTSFPSIAVRDYPLPTRTNSSVDDCAGDANFWLTTVRNGLSALILFIALTYSAAAIGALAVPGPWYASLPKPSWTPPGWVFGPVWSVLYALMAVAGWLVWKQTGWGHTAMLLFGIQLALNTLWSPLFFGLHRPDWAFIDIVALWLAIVATTIAFWRVSATAGLLFLPYLGWVSFATVLNFAIMRMWWAQGP